MLLVFALLQEARPWIDAWKAKGIGSWGKSRAFASDHGYILVTGPGKIPMTVAVCLFCSELRERKNRRVWNLGASGTREIARKIGSFYWINKVLDLASGREEFPSTLEKIGNFPESTLVTVDKPLLSDPKVEKIISEDCLFDMESFGFQVACSYLFPIDNIRIGKWVSDHLHQITEKELVKQSHQTYEILCKEVEKPLPWNISSEPDEFEAILLEAKEMGYTESMCFEVEACLRFFKNSYPNKNLPNLPRNTPDLALRKKNHKKWKDQFAL